MKKNLKTIGILLFAFLLFFAAGCGQSSTQEPSAQSSAAQVTQAPETPVIITQAPEPETEDETVSEEPASSETEESAEDPQEIPQTDIPSEEPEETPEITQAAEEDGLTVEEDGEYTDKEHVALYIHTYGHLPSNYVTKKEAKAAGWDSGAGNLITVLPGKSIGGDRFGNYEGLLPEAKGRQYYECDIDFNPDGKTSGRVTRGPKRIIYSNDGLVFYTEDHYESFEQLY